MSDSGNGWDLDFWIAGEPASAKNQRRIVLIHNKPRVIKSAKALAYEKTFLEQCPPLTALLGDVALRLDVFYASRRPDLAAIDLIMDLLQKAGAYANDRQVKASQSLWNLDKENPRARVRLRELNIDSSLGTSSFQPCEIWGDTEMK